MCIRDSGIRTSCIRLSYQKRLHQKIWSEDRISKCGIEDRIRGSHIPSPSQDRVRRSYMKIASEGGGAGGRHDPDAAAVARARSKRLVLIRTTPPGTADRSPDVYSWQGCGSHFFFSVGKTKSRLLIPNPTVDLLRHSIIACFGQIIWRMGRLGRTTTQSFLFFHGYIFCLHPDTCCCRAMGFCSSILLIECKLSSQFVLHACFFGWYILPIVWP